MIALRQRDVVSLTYDPYKSSGTRSAVVIDGMKTPNHPNVGRIYSVVTITKDQNNQYDQHDWTVELPKEKTETDQPPLKHDSVITPWGTFNIQSNDIASQHTRLNDSGMKRIFLAFQRMILDDVDTN
ncbi:hypothetical protein [Haloarcula sp. 1CSR25-25]|uniref:hypothetical protein n=1 Tax=Haloarcula sp. 1CSR25-25 TaxID=2862545 RepID=UPI0028948950|nr:hypothetical protein [Haloarcula sp. 1CSR25-25]MDT3434678.1 hypothetical protein [Haloarcula sp. 1CSR25-25]